MAGDTTLSAVTKMRLLDEMLGGIKQEGQWAVLLLDGMTTQIISNVCGVSDVLDYGISLVENVAVPRQPAAHLAGVYFITPTDESVAALVADYNRKGPPQYGKVHVFFSSGVDVRHMQAIRACPRLLERLVTLKEISLEYLLYPDYRSFTTAQEGALATFFGADVDSSEEYRGEVEKMASRLATVFVTMKEFPSIRYRAALPPGEEYPMGLESRLLVAQRLAVELHERLSEMQRTGHVPERETCELIITDRGFDPVAPIIHEWTYEAMVHDLLEGSDQLAGKVFSFDTRVAGKVERKEAVVDERDPLFLDLRHRHFAAASIRITALTDHLRARTRTASQPGGVRDMDLREMSKLVQSLPQYRDQMDQLGTHVELASTLNRMVEQHHLADVGKLEQDLVYGDATSKEVIGFLASNQLLSPAVKLRMLMCYSATHQEKLDETRTAQWQKVARLSATDMVTLSNLEYLGVPVMKRRSTSSLGSLTFGRKRRRAVRKDRYPDEDGEVFSLARFVPVLAEVVEDAVSGKLSQDEYPYVRPPGMASAVPLDSMGSGALGSQGSDTFLQAGGTSFRTMRSGGTWAKKAASAIAGGSMPQDRPVEAPMRGARVFAFVIGGFTFSELRTAHRLTARLGRDVVLGGTSVQTPAKFMRDLLGLSQPPPPVAVFQVESSIPAGATGTSKRRGKSQKATSS